MWTDDDHPRITRVTGSTAELRTPIGSGEKRLVLVEVLVREAGGTRKTSDGDVEPIHLSAVKGGIFDVTGVESADTLLAAARAQRRQEDEERNGKTPLPGMGDDPIYLVAFAECGHEAFYPEAWMEREEDEDREVADFWRDQERPAAEGGHSPCPKCDGPPWDSRTVAKVQLVTDELAAKDGSPASSDETEAFYDPAAEEPWPGYGDESASSVNQVLKAWPAGAAGNDQRTKAEVAGHVAAFEKAHKGRVRILNLADELLVGAE